MLDDVKVNYESASYDDLSKRGLYIVSYWNSMDADSKIHTIATQSDGQGHYNIYNAQGKEAHIVGSLDFMGKYITGYSVHPNKEYLNLPKL